LPSQAIGARITAEIKNWYSSQVLSIIPQIPPGTPVGEMKKSRGHVHPLDMGGASCTWLAAVSVLTFHKIVGIVRFVCARFSGME
jgi:hypothetical protein